MKIYLDYNLFVYLYDGSKPDLSAKVDELSDRHSFPYSPAHMEEIATGLIKPTKINPIDRLIQAYQKIESISRISRNLELICRTEYGPMVSIEEPPLECFRRVVRYYDRNPIVERREEHMLASFKATDPDGSLANRVSNHDEDFLQATPEGYGGRLESILNLDNYLGIKCKAVGIKDVTNWSSFRHSFHVTERAIEIAMNYLEEIRYRPEAVRKSRSRMHDVSHCIYASDCQQFITFDDRLRDKVTVVYRYFNIPTQVLTLEEFLANKYD